MKHNLQIVGGHSLTTGPTGAGKCAYELFQAGSTGHTGGIVSIAQASAAKVKRPAQQDAAPYYRQFQKRR